MRYFLSLVYCIGISTAGFSQNPGDAVFNTDQLIHDVRVSFPMNTWYDTLTKNYTLSNQLDSSVYLMGSLSFDGQVFDSVGFKFKGNSSYNNPSQKKSWKVAFEEFKSNNELDGMNELNLNNGFKDPTFLREKICLDFLEKYSLAAPRCDYANVYVNNQLWGFYTLVEEVDKKFLKTRFGNKGGNLFKGDPAGNLTWKGTSQNMYYNNYELKTNETANDWSDLVWLIDNINNTPASDYKDSLDASFNTSEYVKHWATSILFSQLDSYTGSGHNYFIYHNTATDQFEWITWDVNEAFGTFLNGNQQSAMTTLPLNYISNPANSRPLHQKLIANPTYYNAYQNFICNALNDYFNPNTLYPIIDSLHDRIASDFNNDPKKLFPTAQFNSNLTTTVGGALGLKPFVQERYNYLSQQLTNFPCVPLVSDLKDVRDNSLFLYPNPALDVLEVYSPPGNESLEILDLTGRTVLHFSPETKFLDISILQSGAYLLKRGHSAKKFFKL